MKVYGRDVFFKRTIQANCEIVDTLCNGDADQIENMFNGAYVKSQKAAATFISILSEGYEKAQKFNDPDYEPHPITVDEALSLDEDDFSQLFNEALTAWSGEKITVETEEPKPTGKKNVKTKKSA